MKKLLTLILLGFLVWSPSLALASIGVGVGTGKIEVKEEIKPGGIYELPAITVLNTGTEPATYNFHVAYNETQPEKKPKESWFKFSSTEFSLQPGESKLINTTLEMPVTTEPGNYFAYLEARPKETASQGSATIGVAAATKLSFKVVPANAALGIFYRLLYWYKRLAPWSTIFVVTLILIVIKLLLGSRGKFRLTFEKHQKSSK